MLSSSERRGSYSTGEGPEGAYVPEGSVGMRPSGIFVMFVSCRCAGAVRCKSATTRVRKQLGSPLFGAVGSLRQGPCGAASGP